MRVVLKVQFKKFGWQRNIWWNGKEKESKIKAQKNKEKI